jgi:hypothetical protein
MAENVPNRELVKDSQVSVHTPVVHEYGSRSYITKTL